MLTAIGRVREAMRAQSGANALAHAALQRRHIPTRWPIRLISPDGTQSFDLKMHAPADRGARADVRPAGVRPDDLAAPRRAGRRRRSGHAARPRVEQRHVRERRARWRAATLEVDDLVTFGKVAFRLATFIAVDAAGVRGDDVVHRARRRRSSAQMPIRDTRAGLVALNAPNTAPGGSVAVDPLAAHRAGERQSQQKLATLLEVSKGLTRAVDVDTLLEKIVGVRVPDARRRSRRDPAARRAAGAGAQDRARQARRRRRRAPCRSRSRERRWRRRSRCSPTTRCRTRASAASRS